MKKNVLIINPCITDFKLYDEWMHPLGLYLLCDLLEQNDITAWYFDFLSPSMHLQEKKFGTGTFHHQIISKPSVYASINRKYKLYGVPVSVFQSFMENIPSPDCIYVGSAMTYWAPGVVETVNCIHDLYPETPVVLGGIAAQLVPDYFKKNLPYVLNAGDLYTATQGNSGVPLLSGLTLNTHRGSLMGGIEKLKTAPHGPILLSLGCPMRCSYCASSVLQPQYQIRDTGMVIDEIEYLVNRFNTTDFAFYDDALLYKKESVLHPFLSKLNRKGFRIRLHTPNGLHVRFVDSDTLSLMNDSGFTTIRYGYESGQSRYRHDTSGKSSLHELCRTIELTLQHGFSGTQIGVYVMGGLLSQTPEEMYGELEYIHSLGVYVKPVFLSPVPGSTLFETYAEKFPELRDDPLWHNDMFFVTKLSGWPHDTFENIRQRTRILNSTIA